MDITGIWYHLAENVRLYEAADPGPPFVDAIIPGSQSVPEPDLRLGGLEPNIFEETLQIRRDKNDKLGKIEPHMKGRLGGLVPDMLQAGVFEEVEKAHRRFPYPTNPNRRICFYFVVWYILTKRRFC